MTLLVTDENGGFKQRAGSLTISSPALHGKGEADRSEEEEEEEEEEDLFVFNDTIEGPRAPAVKPGRVTQA